MIRVIVGKKGSGKTKQVIEMINSAVDTEHGNVVCIEKGEKLMLDISHKIRLVEASEYDIADYTAMKGFISGLYAGNYDITHIFIDSLTKIIGTEVNFETEKFLDWFIIEQAEEERDTERLVNRMKLFGQDAKGLYALDKELHERL